MPILCDCMVLYLSLSSKSIKLYMQRHAFYGWTWNHTHLNFKHLSTWCQAMHNAPFISAYQWKGVIVGLDPNSIPTTATCIVTNLTHQRKQEEDKSNNETQYILCRYWKLSALRVDIKFHSWSNILSSTYCNIRFRSGKGNPNFCWTYVFVPCLATWVNIVCITKAISTTFGHKLTHIHFKPAHRLCADLLCNT